MRVVVGGTDSGEEDGGGREYCTARPAPEEAAAGTAG